MISLYVYYLKPIFSKVYKMGCAVDIDEQKSEIKSFANRVKRGCFEIEATTNRLQA